MMSGQFLIAFLGTLFFVGCTPPRQVLKKTISHNYRNLSFTPQQIQRLTSGKVEVTVTPIDAASINKETFEAASRDGNYERELATAIEEKKSKMKDLSKADRLNLKKKLNAIEAVEKSEKDGLIPSFTARQLIRRIWYGQEHGNGKDGTEVTSLSSEIESFPDDFNPYKINQKYLSVFKFTFENKGSEIENVSLKELQVISGEELLYPLANDFFEENLKAEPEKVKNIFRMNMPEKLLLTPSQRITKFIAIPAINPKNENLQIQLIKGKEVLNFDFKAKEQETSKNYSLESYDIFASQLDDPFGWKFFYAINYQNGVSFATNNSRVFVSEEKKSAPVSIYVVAVNEATTEARTSRKVNIRFADETKNKVIVPFETMSKKKK